MVWRWRATRWRKAVAFEAFGLPRYARNDKMRRMISELMNSYSNNGLVGVRFTSPNDWLLCV